MEQRFIILIALVLAIQPLAISVAASTSVTDDDCCCINVCQLSAPDEDCSMCAAHRNQSDNPTITVCSDTSGTVVVPFGYSVFTLQEPLLVSDSEGTYISIQNIDRPADYTGELTLPPPKIIL